MRSSPVVLDQVDAAFDDERAVANAGLLLPATLVARLGLEQAADQLINLGERPGAARPGRKLLTVVHSLVDAAPARPLAVGALVYHGPGAAALHSRPRRLTPPDHPSLTPGHHWPGVSLPAPGARQADHHADTIKHDTDQRRTTTAAPAPRLPTQGSSQPAITNTRPVDPG
jgi:hypothetical protein